MNKKNISPEPGKRIFHLRKKLGLTRSQFEEITGVSGSTLRYLETGQRELVPLKAKLLSNLFISLFNLQEHEASADFLLYGNNKKTQKD
jgi:transcriptional regulator with XRE-family HTH domain